MTTWSSRVSSRSTSRISPTPSTGCSCPARPTPRARLAPTSQPPTCRQRGSIRREFSTSAGDRRPRHQSRQGPRPGTRAGRRRPHHRAGSRTGGTPRGAPRRTTGRHRRRILLRRFARGGTHAGSRSDGRARRLVARVRRHGPAGDRHLQRFPGAHPHQAAAGFARSQRPRSLRVQVGRARPATDITLPVDQRNR